MSQKAAKIQDVARIAGVSTATVSRALSHPDKVTERTRDAVFQAIQETGYRVNRAARNLRKQRANAVLVLVPNLGNPFFSQILAGISERLSESDVSVLITDSTHLPKGENALSAYFLDGRIDGMISLDGAVSNDDLRSFSQAGVANRIVCACEWISGADLPSVRSDNFKGAQLAIRHLHDLGHRKIAHVTGPVQNVLTHARREGVMAERHRLGLPARPEWIIRGDFSLASGQEAARLIFAMEDRPSAVFCASDEVAFGLIAGLMAVGLQVPRDISVIGFDDIELAQHYVPALTTIRQDRPALGRRAADLMLDCLAGNVPAAGDKVDTIDVTLIPRASTAAPKP
jgi:LacI family repressor for deo operon, udp, cdd, tsx, nupC, and nupG